MGRRVDEADPPAVNRQDGQSADPADPRGFYAVNGYARGRENAQRALRTRLPLSPRTPRIAGRRGNSLPRRIGPGDKAASVPCVKCQELTPLAAWKPQRTPRTRRNRPDDWQSVGRYHLCGPRVTSDEPRPLQPRTTPKRRRATETAEDTGIWTRIRADLHGFGFVSPTESCSSCSSCLTEGDSDRIYKIDKIVRLAGNLRGVPHLAPSTGGGAQRKDTLAQRRGDAEKTKT